MEKEAFAFLPVGKPSPRPHSPSLYLQAPTELCWQRSNPPCLAASPPHSHIYQCTTRSHLLTLLSRQTQEILRKKNKEKPLKPEKGLTLNFGKKMLVFPNSKLSRSAILLGLTFFNDQYCLQSFYTRLCLWWSFHSCQTKEDKQKGQEYDRC